MRARRSALGAVSIVLALAVPGVATASQHTACPIPRDHRRFPLRIVDGDTFRLHGERIRILGIDTPEVGQPGAERATTRLRALLGSGPLVIVRHGTDVYCRTLADVYVNGWNVADVLRAEGYAKPDDPRVRFRRRARLRAGGAGRWSIDTTACRSWDFRTARCRARSTTVRIRLRRARDGDFARDPAPRRS